MSLFGECKVPLLFPTPLQTLKIAGPINTNVFPALLLLCVQ